MTVPETIASFMSLLNTISKRWPVVSLRSTLQRLTPLTTVENFDQIVSSYNERASPVLPMPDFGSQSNEQMMLNLDAAMKNQCFFLVGLEGAPGPLLGHGIATMEKSDKLFALTESWSSLVLRPSTTRIDVEPDKAITTHRLLGSAFFAHYCEVPATNVSEYFLPLASVTKSPPIKVYLE
jgi:hypothetical protein